MLSNAPGFESQRAALTEILRVREAELATAREGLESARRALMLKQARIDELEAQVRLMNMAKQGGR